MVRLSYHGWNKAVKRGLLSFLLVVIVALIWNNNYGYSFTQWKHLLTGNYIYDKNRKEFTYFGKLYFPRDMFEGAKFFDEGAACCLLEKYDEPVIYNYVQMENEVVYRFSVLGSRHSDITSKIYRIHINEKEKTGYVIYNGDNRIELDALQCDEILAIYSDENFWERTSSHNSLISHYDRVVMEGKRGRQYHAIVQYITSLPLDKFDTVDEAIENHWNKYVSANVFDMDSYKNTVHFGLHKFENIIGGSC